MGHPLDKTSDRLKWVFTGMVILAFLVVDLATPQLVASNEEWLNLVAMGVCIGQVNLIAAWAALAPGNVFLRVPWSLLLAILMWYGLVLGNRADGGIASSTAMELGVVLLAGVLVLQIPLWLAARLFGWRLIGWRDAGDAAELHPRQFHLRHMLLGMAFVSITLALGRVVLPSDELRLQQMFTDADELFTLLTALVVSNIVVAIPCIWGAFVPTRALLPLVLFWMFYVAAVTGAELGTLVVFLGPPGMPIGEALWLFYLFNLAQCITVVGTLLIFRTLGCRLRRVVAGLL